MVSEYDDGERPLRPWNPKTLVKGWNKIRRVAASGNHADLLAAIDDLHAYMLTTTLRQEIPFAD